MVAPQLNSMVAVCLPTDDPLCVKAEFENADEPDNDAGVGGKGRAAEFQQPLGALDVSLGWASKVLRFLAGGDWHDCSRYDACDDASVPASDISSVTTDSRS